MSRIDRAAVAAFIDQEIDDLERELEKLRAAQAIFAGDHGIRHASEKVVAVKPPKGASGKRAAPNASQPAAKRPKITSDDQPIVRMGMVPKVGVQQHLCETLAERRAKVAELKSAGYSRVGLREKLVPGTFDVRPSGDGDESVVVLWREKVA